MVAVQRSNTFLSKTFISTGNKKVFTISFWAKFPGIYTNESADGSSLLDRGNTYQQYGPCIFSAVNSSSVSTVLEFYSHSESLIALSDVLSGTLRFGFHNKREFNSTNSVRMLPRLHDPSGWYHIVFGVDTTQSTADERSKCWINGNQVHGPLSEVFNKGSLANSMNYQYSGTIAQNTEFAFGES